MKSLSVAAKIWAKTVFLNAFFWGAGALFTGNIIEVFKSMLLFFGGFIVTLPLLMLIVPLVNVSALLPYNIAARIAWLTFYLIALIVAFYAVYSKVTTHGFFGSQWRDNSLIGTTIAALVVAVITTRKSLVKLHTQ